MRRYVLLAIFVVLLVPAVSAQRTVKPPLHGRHWVAITGKPLARHRRRDDVPEGRQRRGRRVRDARGDRATMWDTLGGAARPRR